MAKQNVSSDISVLLVIKHELYCKTLAFALGDQHLSLEITGQCCSSDQVVDLYIASHPDIVLMDASMVPESFGQVARRLLAIDAHAKIVAMTNYYDQKRVDRLLKNGAAGCVSRDMCLPEIINILQSFYFSSKKET